MISQNLGSLPPLVTQCHTSSTPLTCDVIYGCPLTPDLQLLPLAPNSLSSFSYYQGTGFSYLNSFMFVICPSKASWNREFLIRIYSIQLTFLRWIFFRNSLSSRFEKPLHSDQFTFSIFFFVTTFQRCPNTYPKIFLMSSSLSHTIQCSKYKNWPIHF